MKRRRSALSLGTSLRGSCSASCPKPAGGDTRRAGGGWRRRRSGRMLQAHVPAPDTEERGRLAGISRNTLRLMDESVEDGVRVVDPSGRTRDVALQATELTQLLCSVRCNAHTPTRTTVHLSCRLESRCTYRTPPSTTRAFRAPSSATLGPLGAPLRVQAGWKSR